MQKGPKIGRRPLRDDQSAVTRARGESPNRRHDGTHRRADPIVLIPPILRQGFNAAAPGGGKFRVKPWNLGVVMRRKPVNCVRAPFGVNNSKYRRIDGPVIFVNKSAEKICSFIKRPRDPLRFQNDVVNKTEIVHGPEPLNVPIRGTNREWYGFEACPKVIPKIHEINLKSVAFLHF